MMSDTALSAYPAGGLQLPVQSAPVERGVSYSALNDGSGAEPAFVEMIPQIIGTGYNLGKQFGWW